MHKTLRILFAALGLIAATSASATIVYETGSYNPWWNVSNDTVMNATFGSGNWIKNMGFNTASFAGASFVYLDGSDQDANQLSAFIGFNQVFLENYVSNGGTLFINAAPNVGGSFGLGFGAMLNYADYSPNATVTAAGVAAGLTAGGITTNYSGNYFGHATVSGAGLSNLVSGNGGRILFGGKNYGHGYVAFGGQTTTNFHNPNANAMTLLSNEFKYVSGQHTQNVPEPESLALLGVGLIGLMAMRRRTRA